MRKKHKIPNFLTKTLNNYHLAKEPLGFARDSSHVHKV